MSAFQVRIRIVLSFLIFGLCSAHAMFVASPSPGDLSSAHAALDSKDRCVECHKNDLSLSPDLCLMCHSGIRSQIESRSGLHATLGDKCATCHPEHRGKNERPLRIDRSFDHSITGFALTGRHAELDDCTACHPDDHYSATDRICTSCHADPHKGRLGVQCQYCHQTDTWKLPLSAQVSHAADFTLTGKHLVTPCEECHLGGDTQHTPRDCEACHWMRRQDDPYRTRLGLECGRCHSPLGWSPANWNHNAETGFRLSGAHQAIACDRCHPSLNFQSAVSECYACHAGDYRNATDPEHKSAGFPTDCPACHRSTSWHDASFTHEIYPLTGAHKTATCGQCHPNGRYQGTPTDCYACHKEDYDRTQAPNHPASGFPTACEQCHSTTDWKTGTFDHNSTGFPLTGAHRTVDCALCHPNGRYQGTPTDCFACHQADFNNAKNPDHRAAGFSTQCADCHNTTAWTGSPFDHNSTGYPLMGPHRNLDCAQCHPNGRYQGTPTECYGCHQPDYENAKNPDHKAAGFPTDCLVCHSNTDMTWNQGRFDHPGFPITTFPHSAYSCSDCHPNPSNYTQFVCTTCHYKSKMDSEHNGVPGYRFDDSFCYACHPDGR